MKGNAHEEENASFAMIFEEFFEGGVRGEILRWFPPYLSKDKGKAAGVRVGKKPRAL